METSDSVTGGKTKSLLNRRLPITEWLPAYKREWLTGDIIVGLTV